MKSTMIQIRKSTAEKLQNMKRFGRETYDDVINNLLSKEDNEPLSKEEIREIEQGLEDVKAGRVHSIEEAARELKVKLKNV